MSFNKIMLLCLVALISSCGSTMTRQDVRDSVPVEDRQLAGGYTAYRTPSDDELALFSQCYAYAAQLTPKRVATQVVAGFNYAFLCTGAEGDVKVVIYKPLPNHGASRVTSVEPVSAYDALVAFVAKGFADQWQRTSPDDMELSPIYQYRTPTMGYARADINGDGIVELLLGDDFSADGYAVYDLFTFDPEQGTVRHLFSGGERDRLTILDDGILCEEGSNSAFDSFRTCYRIEGGKLVKLPQDTPAKETLFSVKFHLWQ